MSCITGVRWEDGAALLRENALPLRADTRQTEPASETRAGQQNEKDSEPYGETMLPEKKEPTERREPVPHVMSDKGVRLKVS